MVRDSVTKYNDDILIYGADISTNVVGRYFVDIFWKMPRIKDLSVNFFIDYCSINEIKYVIPTRDQDVEYFSCHKSFLEKNGIYVFSADKKAVSFCFDKLKFYELSKNFNVIPTFNDLEKVKTDSVVVKERFGAGSSSIMLGVNKREIVGSLDSFEEPIFQPFIRGDEYSIDSYLSKNGVCLACVIRSRNLIIDGEAKITTIEEDQDLKSIVISFLQRYEITGHSVIQVIKTGKEYYIIECNARFGGASSLSYKVGLESFYWFLQEVNSKTINPQISNKKLKQVRVSKDIYIES